MLKVRNCGGKEIPLIEGKEQQLCFAGTAMKRYAHVQGKRNPSKMVDVARRHQRADAGVQGIRSRDGVGEENLFIY